MRSASPNPIPAAEGREGETQAMKLAADTPCPMERLADRLVDCPKPEWLNVIATRTPWGTAAVELTFDISDPDSIDDVVAYLERAKG